METVKGILLGILFSIGIVLPNFSQTCLYNHNVTTDEGITYDATNINTASACSPNTAFTISATGNKILKSPNYIQLSPGFSAYRGSNFVAVPRCILNYNDWTLLTTISDDFNGSTINTSKWNVANYTTHLDEPELYLSNACSLATGVSGTTDGYALVIKLDNLNPGIVYNSTPYYYSSGLITSTSSFLASSTNGSYLFEIRCKIPCGNGRWPAFWLWGNQSSIYGEMDIFEFFGGSATENSHSFTTNLFWTEGSCQSEVHSYIYDFCTEWHTFSAIWTTTKVIYFLDGYELRTIDTHVPSITMSQLIANLALHGTDNLGTLPSYFYIDYIRVYNTKSNPLSISNCQYVECNEMQETFEPALKKAITYSDYNTNNFTNETIFPNPTSGIVTLNLSHINSRNVKLSIINTLGEEIFYKDLGKVKNIDFSFNLIDQMPGMYILKIILDDEISYKKIILNK